jgi:threonylcarbamoyladenosine tRNA methylthiotransferase MtaB
VGTFYVENFGCRATQADGAAIDRQLRDSGLERVTAASGAQVVVLNTCTVTAAADQDARAAIRRVRRENPGCKIVVTGCYAQRAPEEIAALPGVDWVIGNSHKPQLAEIVGSTLAVQAEKEDQEERECSPRFVPLASLVNATIDQRPTTRDRGQIFVSDIFAHTELLEAPVFDGSADRTRPNLKVQDGCDNRCSFCVIPYVRGQSRSLRLEQIIREVESLVSSGYREVVISGINLGRWGRDLDGAQHFEALVRAVLERTALEKLRISSVEPMDWSDELIDLVATSPRIAKHAHVPMQSGSDAVLRRMHRKYRPWHYREKIEKIRRAVPDAAIGADVMVGFPAESDAEFEETRRMIEELPFTYLHVFTYSARPGTPASEIATQVPVRIARDRNRILRELAASKKLAFMRSFIGRRVQAITLSTGGGAGARETVGGYTDALTDNYLKLRVQGLHAANQWISPEVLEVLDGELIGRTPDHLALRDQPHSSDREDVCFVNS